MRTVAVSGYFDPLHYGHIEYLQAARKLGDYLVVIVNNRAQTVSKKGYEFMPIKQRAALMGQIKGVDEVVVSVDEDGGVGETLLRVRPDVFAFGADYLNSSAVSRAQMDAIAEIGCEVAYGVGGSKIQSSSTLARQGQAAQHMTDISPMYDL